MDDKDTLSVYIAPDDKRAIGRAATRDGRSMSAQVAWIIRQWLAENGATEDLSS